MHRLTQYAACGALLALLTPGLAAAQNNATCSIPATTRADATLNPPGGEDMAFLSSQATGSPSIAFLLDTSENMRRLPIDLTDPTVVGTGPDLVLRGCLNPTLNNLIYEANPCLDDHNNPLNGGGCTNGKPNIPLGTQYSNSNTYVPYGNAGGAPFASSSYYVQDYGWAANVYTPTSFATGTAACTTAGITGAENATCAACLDAAGYYIPQNLQNYPTPYVTGIGPMPVFKGNWLNFNPPRHIIGRMVFLQLFGYFASNSNFSQSQFRIVSGSDTSTSCFSQNKGQAGMDSSADGIVNMGPGASTKYRGGCLGGSVSNSYWPQTENVTNMFSGWTSGCTAGATAAVNMPTAGVPTGATKIVFKPTADGVCHMVYEDASNNILGPAICAPYAEALLQAGSTLPANSVYNTLLSSKPANTWINNNLNGGGLCPSASCARGAVIMVAAGHPGFDDNLPCEIIGNGVGCTNRVGSAATCGGVGSSASGNLPRVAAFLASNDFSGNGSNVNINTYVIGFGSADPTLVAAANQGKGKFILASSADGLKSAIINAVKLASSTEVTLSTTAFSEVQTKSSSSLLVPRFTPQQNNAVWAGHLFQFKLVSEDACGCNSATVSGGTDPCDFNGDKQCGGVFFQDSQGSFIAAASDGVYYKASLSGGVFSPTTTVAVPFWDASTNLNYGTRKIYTVIDQDSSGTSDGLFDYHDKVISFDTSNAATLLPYLNIGPGGGSNVCTDLSSRLGVCLDALNCAKQIINYVRGQDIFDENCNGNTAENRPSILGDIYHSSPVVVDPPLASSSTICQLGLHNQCVVSLFQTATPMVSSTSYDDYVNATQYNGVPNKNRDKIVLVGSNDGMLHAIRSGSYSASCYGNTSPPTNCNPQTGYDFGDGKEMWAFIPPDLLGKLTLLVENNHAFYVDGNPMVRDVWADGSGGSPVPDGKKAFDEFHTVAVVGERRGGDHFFALDVTNPAGPTAGTTGFFRWIFPQPNTAASRVAGQSFNDFLPQPPPIGPVRLKNTTTPGLPTYAPPGYTAVPYEERWVAFLNGGFDISGVKGRNVNLVDAWYGGQGLSNGQGSAADPTQALWTFDPETTLGVPAFPFAAVPALMGFGVNSANANNDVNGYFFDTATVGDTGGQLWTLRFNHPDPTKWAGGRAFVTDSNATTNYCARQPFFQPTANTVDLKGGHLHTLLGTGDRLNLTDLNGGVCSTTNLLACQRRGCQVSISYKLSNACGTTTTLNRSFSSGGAASCAMNSDNFDVEVPSSSANCCAAGASNTMLAQVTYTLSGCSGANGNISWTQKAACTPSTATATMCGATQPAQYVCDVISPSTFDVCDEWSGCNAPVVGMPSNGFYSVKMFDDTGARQIFNDPSGAAAYDTAHLSTGSAGMVAVNPLTNTGNATASSEGWYANYVQTTPSHESLYPGGFTGSSGDERTATPTTLIGGCAFWGTFTPPSTTASCSTATTGLNTQYHLNFLSGGPCAGLDQSLLSSSYTQAVASSPPAAPQITMFIAPNGTVTIGLPSSRTGGGTGGGTTPPRASQTSSATQNAYGVDVPRTLHACRHQDLTQSLSAQHAAAAANCPLPQ